MRIGVRIADTTLQFNTRSEALAAEIRSYFGEYLGEFSPEANLFVEPMASPSFAGLWEDPDPEFHCQEDSVVQRDFAARRFEGNRIVACVTPGELSDALLNLLRWTLPDLLLSKGFFLVHGASVMHAGGGYLFFGPSGAGKSTAVGLIAKSDSAATILGDDAAIIQKAGDGTGYWLHAAPLGSAWTNLAPAPAKVPLLGMFSLTQSAEHRVETLAVSEGMAALLASVMIARFDTLAEARLDLAADFAGSPCGVARLHFRNEAGFWPLIRGARLDSKESHV